MGFVDGVRLLLGYSSWLMHRAGLQGATSRLAW
jgi:hypothetical protein